MLVQGKGGTLDVGRNHAPFGDEEMYNKATVLDQQTMPDHNRNSPPSI